MHSRLRSGWRRTLAQDFRRRFRADVLHAPIRHDRIARSLAAASLVAILGLVAYVTLWLPTLPPFLPLHYNGLGSVDLLGPRNDLYKMPAIGVSAFVADFVVATSIYRRERWAALTVIGASVLVQIILIVATINIVRLAFGD